MNWLVRWRILRAVPSWGGANGVTKVMGCGGWGSGRGMAMEECVACPTLNRLGAPCLLLSGVDEPVWFLSVRRCSLVEDEARERSSRASDGAGLRGMAKLRSGRAAVAGGLWAGCGSTGPGADVNLLISGKRPVM